MTQCKIRSTLIRSTLAMLLGGTAAIAQAQEAAGNDDSMGSEIIVTASKRAENVQDIPISVTALTGEALSQSRTTRVDELVTKVPNLQMSGTAGDNIPIFALRGVSMSDYSLNQSSPVATYYDEVYKGNFALLGVALFDIERVEVLRGPQGTLYGKNTTGGAVNVISRAPKLGETNGYVNLGYGNYNRFDANGAVNVPLGKNVAARIAGTYSKADGWFKNQTPGQPDLASVSEYGIRGSILFEPSDSMSFTLRGSTTYQNPRNYGIYAQPEAVNRAGLSSREIRSNLADTRRKARTYSASLTGNVDVSDTLSITSITSWDKGTLSLFEDTDGQDSRVIEIPYYARAEQFAQDLRLTSDFDGPFNFILGAYYNKEKVFNQTTLYLFADTDSDGVPGMTDQDCVAGFPAGCLVDNSFDQLKESIALYSDMSYDISDTVQLRGGIRYTHDSGKQDNFRADAFGVNGVLAFPLIPTPATADRPRYATDNISGKIGLDFTLPDGDLIYVNYSRGYRAPSFNAQAFFDPSELGVAEDETVNAYEIGAKTQFSDRQITLNMAAFYYDYRNQQFINVDPTTAAQQLLNIPKSRILGGEAELSVRTSEIISLRAGLGLLSTKIEEGTVSGVDVSGNELANAPSLTFNSGFDATVMDNNHGKLNLSGDLSYASNQFFEAINIPRLKQGNYVLLSAHIDWESANGKFNASVWGKNLSNEFYFTSRIDLLTGFGLDYNHVGSPRTYGVTVGLKF